MLWVEREVAAGADEAWALLTDVDRWPQWGPSVRDAGLDDEGPFEPGATGWVRTPLRIRLRFEITEVTAPGEVCAERRWGWRVAGLPATEHRVRPLDQGRCRVGFGVPTVAAPYAIVCRRALITIDGILSA